MTTKKTIKCTKRNKKIKGKLIYLLTGEKSKYIFSSGVNFLFRKLFLCIKPKKERKEFA